MDHKREIFASNYILSRWRIFGLERYSNASIFLTNFSIYIFFKLVLFVSLRIPIILSETEIEINIRASNITISQLSTKLYLLTVDGAGQKINRELDSNGTQVPNIDTLKRKKYIVSRFWYKNIRNRAHKFQYIYIYTRDNANKSKVENVYLS